MRETARKVFSHCMRVYGMKSPGYRNGNFAKFCGLVCSYVPSQHTLSARNNTSFIVNTWTIAALDVQGHLKPRKASITTVAFVSNGKISTEWLNSREDDWRCRNHQRRLAQGNKMTSILRYINHSLFYVSLVIDHYQLEYYT